MMFGRFEMDVFLTYKENTSLVNALYSYIVILYTLTVTFYWEFLFVLKHG